MRLTALGALLSLLVAVGCRPGIIDSTPPGEAIGTGSGGAGVPTGNTTGNGGSPGSTGGGATTGGGGSGGTSGPPPATGIPCDVQTVFITRCQGCHSSTPTNGAPMALVTLADLRAPAKSNPALTVAQLVSTRINSTTAPMPPIGQPQPTAAEKQTVTAWVTSGAPQGVACGVTTTTGAGGTTGTGGTTVTGVGGSGGGGGGATGTGGTGVVANGIPCDVATLLQNRCTACHRSPPLNGAPMPLLTYANLTATSFTDATMTFAQRALARMQNNTTPMPPAPNARASATEITAMSNWINARYPMGTCTPTTTTGTGGTTGGTGGATGTGGAGGATGTGGTGGASGLPCDVQTVFQTHCTTCHAATPNSGAPMPLVTYANLRAASFANAAQTFAQRAVMRMQGNPSQMPPPPGAAVSAGEITTVNNWIAAGYPTGTCGTTPPPPDPFSVAPRCTSNTFWTQGNEGSPLMNPGLSCLSCHTGGGGGGGEDDEGGDDGEAPLYTIAGTLYPTAHEPNLCNGSNGSTNGARVVIVDAANRTITLTPNAAGNFFYAGAVTFPFHAKVTFQGRERIMTAAQSNGSCNACHTQNGANGAPGRIILP